HLLISVSKLPHGSGLSDPPTPSAFPPRANAAGVEPVAFRPARAPMAMTQRVGRSAAGRSRRNGARLSRRYWWIGVGAAPRQEVMSAPGFLVVVGFHQAPYSFLRERPVDGRALPPPSWPFHRPWGV